MNSDSDLTYEEVREIVVGMLDKLERNLTNRLYHRLQQRKGRLPSQTDGREDSSPSAHYWKGKGDGMQEMSKGGGLSGGLSAPADHL